jgi:MFS family permease
MSARVSTDPRPPAAASALARRFPDRSQYAWIVMGLTFIVIVTAVGVRAAPGVLIVPLQKAFGWNTAVISGAVSVNIMLFGLVSPFAAGLIEVIGMRWTILSSMALLTLGAGLSAFVTQIWQLYLTWGVLVGLGSGAGMVGLATAIANRWFSARRGLVVGLLTAGNASGQLVFLPVLASLIGPYGWRMVPAVVALVILALMPAVLLLLPESPAQLGSPAFGATDIVPLPPRRQNPFAIAIAGLGQGVRSIDFWLLFITFSVCGFSTNGLVATHLIPYCMDHGIPEVTAASLLASLGIFDLVGTTVSGYLTDRCNPRILLFWYYGLRGLSLAILPFTNFDMVSLSVFAVFYGLDWVATVPPTVMLTTQVFGRQQAPVMVSWIFAGHQIGGALAAFGAGEARTLAGSYIPAFLASGVACLMASLLVLRINRARVAVA